MTIISILILVFFVLSSILLITIVLIQDDQGGGIGGMFGGGGSAAFGARTGNVLTRITTVLAIIFFILSLDVVGDNSCTKVIEFFLHNFANSLLSG